MGEPTAPGWYPDGARLRWYDGASWTSHIVERLAPDPAPAAAVPDPALVPRPVPLAPSAAAAAVGVEPDLASALGGERLVPDADRLAPAPLPPARPRAHVAPAVAPPATAPLPPPALPLTSALPAPVQRPGPAPAPAPVLVGAAVGGSVGGAGSWQPPPEPVRALRIGAGGPASPGAHRPAGSPRDLMATPAPHDGRGAGGR